MNYEVYVIWDNMEQCFIESYEADSPEGDIFRCHDIDDAKMFPTEADAHAFAEGILANYVVLQWM